MGRGKYMPSLADLVPIPAGINSGLSACREEAMLGKFGRPGNIYEIFNARGWFWGAGFSLSSVDTMHFELADQTVRALDDAPLSPDTLISVADYIDEMGYDTVVQEA